MAAVDSPRPRTEDQLIGRITSVISGLNENMMHPRTSNSNHDLFM